MRKNHFLRLAILLILAGSGCTKTEHFITDSKFRDKVSSDFQIKSEMFDDVTLFSIFRQEMTISEREAMEFLYAYMPIGDVVDYDGEYYLRNVRSSIEVRKEMPWGKDIPELIFRHFVLPVRINNENLDESRIVFLNELRDRIKGLSLHDAALEVNHWCHEKVTYTPSDARTSSPLSSVRSAYGRCGEESTFAVAALRAVGIPARQVYTPRWAHTDDNHAWVEVWVDGRWYFMGACEPQPVLNLGWFNDPAYRAMLMHTKVFGYYTGPEEVMEQTKCYTEINVIENYAPAANAIVAVKDTDGRPVEGATVEFKLYNYAEFYTVSRKTTDTAGKTFLSAGMGDMLVWASKDGKYGFSKLSFGKDSVLTLVLDKTPGDVSTSTDIDITPPVQGRVKPETEATAGQKEDNEKRLHEEDVIRNKYAETFYTEEKAGQLAEELSLKTEQVKDIMIKSRGNHAEIETFLRDAGNKPLAIALLSVISNKDLRDTRAEVLGEHLLNYVATPAITKLINEKADLKNNEEWRLFTNYVLNPRVANEYLTAYKKYFSERFDKSLAASSAENPRLLVEWVKENVAVDNSLNPQRIPVMPAGVWKGRIADVHSRNIFFVSLARSLGIASRLEPVTGKVQFYKDKWIDVDFEVVEKDETPEGRLEAGFEPTGSLDNPKYYSQFTIAKINDETSLKTLNFKSNSQSDMGSGDTWKDMLRAPKSLVLDQGYYLLVTGTRMASGKVLSRLTFFPVAAGKTTTVSLQMREDNEDIQVMGNIDAEAVYAGEDGTETSILNTTGRGYFVIGLLGANQEPTNHALRDIAKLSGDFEKWNRSIIFLFKNEREMKLFDKNEFGKLPATVTYGVDTKSNITNMIVKAMHLQNAGNLPVFIIADTFGRVVFVSQGYTIGLGEQMMKVINKL
jgi:hypothetical protein